MDADSSYANKKRKLAEPGAEDIAVQTGRWPVTNGNLHTARPLSANTARLYPEWGLPEPVAVPQAAEPLQELSWPQSSHIQQSSDGQPAVSQQRSNHDQQSQQAVAADIDMISREQEPAALADEASNLSAQQTSHVQQQPPLQLQADADAGMSAHGVPSSFTHHLEAQSQATGKHGPLNHNQLSMPASHQLPLQQSSYQKSPGHHQPHQQSLLQHLVHQAATDLHMQQHQLPSHQIQQQQQQHQHQSKLPDNTPQHTGTSANQRLLQPEQLQPPSEQPQLQQLLQQQHLLQEQHLLLQQQEQQRQLQQRQVAAQPQQVSDLSQLELQAPHQAPGPPQLQPQPQQHLLQQPLSQAQLQQPGHSQSQHHQQLIGQAQLQQQALQQPPGQPQLQQYDPLDSLGQAQLQRSGQQQSPGQPQLQQAGAVASQPAELQQQAGAVPSQSAELRQQPGAGPSNTAGMAASNLGAYSQRELYLQNLEDKGDMSFEYVLNDGQRHNNIWLIALKNIFSKQLPNMPREYIARLVLDRRHRSVAIVRQKRNVVGGITYRPFHQQGFGEIAFCAVTANEQVKGFGTRLMNFTKEYAKTQDHLTHFLTYADNNAVGYFAKQGFTKEITLDKECWVGFIKDYDGGTLMECVIVQRLPHTRLPAMLQAQKAALESCIRHYSKSHVVREGLKDFQNGARHVDIASIPGVKDAGWDPGDSSGTGVQLLMNNSILDATPNNLQHFMLMVVRQMQACEDFWCFLLPVLPEDVPDYRDVIKDPVDLSLLESRLKQKDYYLTLDIFAADMRRIFNNCRLYNTSDSIWYKSANRAEAFFDHFMHTHLLFGQT